MVSVLWVSDLYQSKLPELAASHSDVLLLNA